MRDGVKVIPSHAMSMTLRLSPEEDEALRALARAEGVSKNEAAARAIVERAERIAHTGQVRDLTRRAIAEYGPLLERLAQ